MTPPERFRPARCHVETRPALDEKVEHFALNVGGWLYERRGRLQLDSRDDVCFRWELSHVEDELPFAHALRHALDRVVARAAADVLDDNDFHVDAVSIHGTLFHHQGFHAWHTDDPVNALAYALFLHTSPRMFDGGQLEFMDGTLLEPDNGTLVLYDPRQRHRVRPVECWSASVLSGRWALEGWIHPRLR